MQANQKKLRKVLRINASFSTISGLLLIFDKPLIDKMGIGNYTTPMIIGIGLLIFAASIFFYASRKTIRPKEIKSVIVQDLAWVIGSIAVLIIRPWALESLGYLLIAAIMVVVGVFGVLQHRLLVSAKSSTGN